MESYIVIVYYGIFSDEYDVEASNAEEAERIIRNRVAISKGVSGEDVECIVLLKGGE